MASGSTSLSEREERFGEIAFAYLRAREEGSRPDPREWRMRYPEFDAELVEFFAAQEAVERLGAPLREIAQAVEPLGDFEIVREVGRGGMGVVYEAVQR